MYKQNWIIISQKSGKDQQSHWLIVLQEELASTNSCRQKLEVNIIMQLFRMVNGKLVIEYW
jgi:hypothetical protein